MFVVRGQESGTGRARWHVSHSLTPILLCWTAPGRSVIDNSLHGIGSITWPDGTQGTGNFDNNMLDNESMKYKLQNFMAEYLLTEIYKKRDDPNYVSRSEKFINILPEDTLDFPV